MCDAQGSWNTLKLGFLGSAVFYPEIKSSAHSIFVLCRSEYRFERGRHCCVELAFDRLS